jgi:hypothetical protein
MFDRAHPRRAHRHGRVPASRAVTDWTVIEPAAGSGPTADSRAVNSEPPVVAPQGAEQHHVDRVL